MGAARGRVVETLDSPDGRHRVVIVRRADGLYGFDQLARYERAGGESWASLGPGGTIADTPEAALREARAAIPWLRT